jgi:hypothetical protein
MGATASVWALSLTEATPLVKADAYSVEFGRPRIHIGFSDFDCSMGAVG